MGGQCGLLTEVFHLKRQNNFPLTCWESVLLCHFTHNAVPDMRHRWTRGNLRGRLRLVRTRSGPWALWHLCHEHQRPSQCVLHISWSHYNHSGLLFFPPCVLAVIWSSGDRSRAAEALVSAARGTNPCVTMCNIIKKSVLCFIQPIRANQCEPSVWWEGGKGGFRGCWGPGWVCYSSVSEARRSVWIAVFG